MSALESARSSLSFPLCSRNNACNSEAKYTSNVKVKNIVKIEKTSSRFEEGTNVETVEDIETDQ